jgi:hypothetical protein
MQRLKLLFFLSLILTASCNSSPLGSNARTEPTVETTEQENFQPPFPSKEPEKYQAEIVFAFKFDEAAANFIEQTTFVARDGLNRRLDFEIGDKRQVSRIETADGKHFVLLPQRKIYAEIAAGTSENLVAAPEDYPLARLLHAKPADANFQRIGAEDFNGKSLVKYRIDFGAVRQTENTRSETFVWIDENSGFPIKTEISAIVDGKPGGAKSVAELRDFKTEVEPQFFIVPADYRKVSAKEIQEYLSQNRLR